MQLLDRHISDIWEFCVVGIYFFVRKECNKLLLEIFILFVVIIEVTYEFRLSIKVLTLSKGKY